MSNRDQRWLNVAIKLADVSQERMQHGCVIVLGGAVQGMGINTARNQPGMVEHIDCLSVHAEINALRRCRRTQGAVAYIARVKNGEERPSRPCINCIKKLELAGIKRVVYTVDGSEYL